MATGRVTWNRTGAEPLETELGTGSFVTGSKPARTAKPWTRRKKVVGIVKTPEKTVWTRPKNHGPVHPVRTGSPGPTVQWNRPGNRKPDRNGSPGPTVPWNRTRNRTVPPDWKTTSTSNARHFLLGYQNRTYNILLESPWSLTSNAANFVLMKYSYQKL